jgi:hypothetical protein
VSSDPFAPPKAELERKVEPTPPPRRVKQAAALIWTAAGIDLMGVLAMWAGLVTLMGVNESGAMASVTASSLVGSCFWLLLSFLILKGRNWARWTFAVFTGFGLVSILFLMITVTQMPRYLSTYQMLSGLVHATLHAVAMVLTFTRGANQWFSAMRATY